MATAQVTTAFNARSPYRPRYRYALARPGLCDLKETKNPSMMQIAANPSNARGLNWVRLDESSFTAPPRILKLRAHGAMPPPKCPLRVGSGLLIRTCLYPAFSTMRDIPCEASNSINSTRASEGAVPRSAVRNHHCPFDSI